MATSGNTKQDGEIAERSRCYPYSGQRGHHKTGATQDAQNAAVWSGPAQLAGRHDPGGPGEIPHHDPGLECLFQKGLQKSGIGVIRTPRGMGHNPLDLLPGQSAALLCCEGVRGKSPTGCQRSRGQPGPAGHKGPPTDRSCQTG